MERDLASYLNITIDKLYEYIDYAAEKAGEDWAFNTDIFNQKLASIVENLQLLEHIDSVMCFHLSRRLNDALDDLRSYNLKDLLLGNNAMVKFLNEHDLFFKGRGNQISVYYGGRELELKNTMDSDVCYLRSRFGYNPGREDFCFNGFAMRDLLMKNSYTRSLYNGPEFLVVLARYLRNNTIIDDLIRESTYFCFTLKIPMEQVIFDGFGELDSKQKELHFIEQICYRLLMYKDNGRVLSDQDNPIIRVSHNAILPADHVIGRETITLEMEE